MPVFSTDTQTVVHPENSCGVWATVEMESSVFTVVLSAALWLVEQLLHEMMQHYILPRSLCQTLQRNRPLWSLFCSPMLFESSNTQQHNTNKELNVCRGLFFPSLIDVQVLTQAWDAHLITECCAVIVEGSCFHFLKLSSYIVDSL